MTTAEKRKHIKPFLRFAIKELQTDLKRGRTSGLCIISTGYCHEAFPNINWWSHEKEELSVFLKERLMVAKPRGTNPKGCAYWWDDETINGIQKRIDFCKLQLKIVKL